MNKQLYISLCIHVQYILVCVRARVCVCVFVWFVCVFLAFCTLVRMFLFVLFCLLFRVVTCLCVCGFIQVSSENTAWNWQAVAVSECPAMDQATAPSRSCGSGLQMAIRVESICMMCPWARRSTGWSMPLLRPRPPLSGFSQGPGLRLSEHPPCDGTSAVTVSFGPWPHGATMFLSLLRQALPIEQQAGTRCRGFQSKPAAHEARRQLRIIKPELRLGRAELGLHPLASRDLGTCASFAGPGALGNVPWRERTCAHARMPTRKWVCVCVCAYQSHTQSYTCLFVYVMPHVLVTSPQHSRSDPARGKWSTGRCVLETLLQVSPAVRALRGDHGG